MSNIDTSSVAGSSALEVTAGIEGADDLRAPALAPTDPAQGTISTVRGELASAGNSYTIDTSEAVVVSRDGLIYVIVPDDKAALMAAASSSAMQQAVPAQQLGFVTPEGHNHAAQYAAAAAPLVVLVTNGRVVYVDGRYVIPARAADQEELEFYRPVLTQATGEVELLLDGRSAQLQVSDSDPT